MKIATVSRTLGPWGAGLVGYDADGRLVIVLKINTKKPVEWARAGVNKADRVRVAKAAQDL